MLKNPSGDCIRQQALRQGAGFDNDGIGSKRSAGEARESN